MAKFNQTGNKAPLELDAIEAKTPNDDFDAKVNVTFSFPIHLFPELAEVNKSIYLSMKEANPEIKTMPTGLTMVTLSAGSMIKVSETPEVRSDGAVFSYPVSLFKHFNAKTLEAPNPIKGEVQPITAGATLSGIPADVKEQVVALMQSKHLNSRFIHTPLLEQVA